MTIKLQKGQRISLQKGGNFGLGEILVNLNWNRHPVQKKGFFSQLFGGSGHNSDTGIDLDLACLYELKNGYKGVVQALGNLYGNLSDAPYICLDNDDRTGDSEHGENLRINGNKIAMIKRILVFTFIYEGITSWKQADARVTISYPGAEDIIVNMDEYDTELTTCGLLLLENVNDQTFSIEKIVKFYQGHIALDKAFNWGITWGKPARK